MAIDTETKRRSAQVYPFQIPTYPDPSGTIGGDSRRHAAGMYSGLSVSISYTAYGPIFLYTADNWTGHTDDIVLEVTWLVDAGNAYADLYDLTAAGSVSDSPITTASATITRTRTASSLTLVDGHEYRVRFGTDDTTHVSGAKLIFNSGV